jgi:catechol 2,3-dioxygenase-like lactoylglutathione lyase family enzyme
MAWRHRMVRRCIEQIKIRIRQRRGPTLCDNLGRMIQCIDHVNIVVRDLTAMVEFYTCALGLTVSKQVTISGPWIQRVVGLDQVEAEVVYLEAPGGARLELIDYRHPRGDRPDALDQPNTHGLRHLAFRVSDIETSAQRLRDAGATMHGNVEQVPDAQVQYRGSVRKRLIYFNDPEGNLLELCEYR